MVYKRRYTKRKNNKRMIKRYRPKNKIYRPIRQQVYYFSRFVDRGPINYNSTLNADVSITGYHFNLTDVPGYAEFTALFNYYKIVAIKVMLIPLSNVALVDAAAVSSVPTYASKYSYRTITVIDTDDQDITSYTLNTLREYKTCKITPNDVIHKRYFHPKVRGDVETSPGFSVGSAQSSPWLNTDSPDIRYYGLKLGFEQVPNQPTERYRFECKYYMKFKQPK